MQMSVSNYDLLQAKVDAELARYTHSLRQPAGSYWQRSRQYCRRSDAVRRGNHGQEGRRNGV